MNYKKLCVNYYKFQKLIAERYKRLYETCVNSGYEMSENETNVYNFVKDLKASIIFLSFEFPSNLFIIKCEIGVFEDLIVNRVILSDDSEFENYLDCINDTRSVF